MDAATTAFVVSEVGDQGSEQRKRADEVCQYILEPVLAQHDLEAYRAHLDPRPGTITPTMLQELLAARVVVADLTGRNPNVYYELGIVHAFARPLVMLVDTVDQLPFDTSQERVIVIGPRDTNGLSAAQAETAKEQLGRQLSIALAADYVPPSPVRDAASFALLQGSDDPIAEQVAEIAEIVRRVEANTRQASFTTFNVGASPQSGTAYWPSGIAGRYVTPAVAFTAADAMRPFTSPALPNTSMAPSNAVAAPDDLSDIVQVLNSAGYYPELHNVDERRVLVIPEEPNESVRTQVEQLIEDGQLQVAVQTPSGTFGFKT